MHPVTAMLMVLAAPVALGSTAEELAAKNLAARGGTDKLHAIQSLRFSGKVLVNGGTLELGYLCVLKRPQSIRCDASLQGLTLVEAYDGTQAWKINPFQGRKDPEKLSADDAKGLGGCGGFRRHPGGLQSQGLRARLSGYRGRRWHRGAQAASDAAKRRHHLRLPRSGLFPRGPHDQPAHRARRAQRDGHRLRRLRTGEWCLLPVCPGVGPQGLHRSPEGAVRQG